MIPVLHIGSLTFYTFGLIVGFAIVLGYLTFGRYFVLHHIPVDMPVSATIVVAAALIGAKLDDAALTDILGRHGHLFVGSFFYIASAGYTYLGSILMAIATFAVIVRINRLPFLRSFDSMFCVGLSYAVGRVGCFMAGDGDYGIPSNLPWAMSFPHGLVPTSVRVHPTMLYQTAFELTLFVVLWRISNPRRTPPLPPGTMFGLYLVFSGLGRFLVEFLSLNPILAFGFKEAQLVSLAFIAAGTALLLHIYLPVVGRRPFSTVTADDPAPFFR